MVRGRPAAVNAVSLIAGCIALTLFWCYPTGPVAGEAAQGVQLTPAEEGWLLDHPVITFAPDPAYPPLEFYDEDGIHRGIAADYLSLVEERLPSTTTSVGMVRVIHRDSRAK